jgi:hypothetical protein
MTSNTSLNYYNPTRWLQLLAITLQIQIHMKSSYLKLKNKKKYMKIYYHTWLLNTPDVLESLYVVFGFKVNNFVNMIFFYNLGLIMNFFQYIYIF